MNYVPRSYEPDDRPICPRCNGDGDVPFRSGPVHGLINCPTCDGAGRLGELPISEYEYRGEQAIDEWESDRHLRGGSR